MTIAEPYCTIMNTALMEAVRHTVGLVSEQLCRKSRSRRESDPVSSYKQHRPQSVWSRTNTTHPDPTSPPTTRYFTAAKIINTHTLNIRLLRIPVCVYLTTESCTVCALQFVRYDTTVENIKDLLLLRTTTHTHAAFSTCTCIYMDKVTALNLLMENTFAVWIANSDYGVHY